MVRFAFLGRVSREDLQDPVASRQWQLARVEALVAGHGRIVAEFFDVGQSRAVSWLRRPESARLLEALEHRGREFDAVVIGEPQRVFYDNQFGLVFPLFVHFKVALWVPEVGGALDPDSEAHCLIMSMYAGMSKAERRRIQVRVRAAMAAQAEREGRYLGGRPPYGYRLADAGPHHNPVLAALGARCHRLELDLQVAPVVERIFALRLDGWGGKRIAGALNADGVSCPSAHDRCRNRHRSGAGWTAGTVLSILGNPRYTGHQVWNKQSRTDVLVDPHNVGLGTRTLMRWNRREDWVTSRRIAHPAIVSVEDFELAQDTRVAGASTRRSYLLRGLLRCGLCGRRMQGAWNNGRANYRCHHRHGGREDWPASVSVREDAITSHLGAVLIRAIAERSQAEAAIAFENVDIPRGEADQAALCRRLSLELTYDHHGQSIIAQGGRGPIVLSLR
ncbi:recombinase family protein [Spirillospora sp. CA-142024]|uniref:recombinase family protein n=1 Tax=Spirillospora sp. CA-142024 TaxID=3240036 RepID=UPI003D8D2325